MAYEQLSRHLRHPTANFGENNIYTDMSKLMILAIGGAGCNMAEAFMREASVQWVRDAAYLFADTDQSRLDEPAIIGHKTINLNDTGFSDVDLNNVESLYVLAGLGGDTGSTYVTDAVSAARSAGKAISAIVTMPFYFEGDNIVDKAKEALATLKGVPTKVLYNDDLLKLYGDMNIATAFHYSDMAALRAIESDEI